MLLENQRPVTNSRRSSENFSIRGTVHSSVHPIWGGPQNIIEVYDMSSILMFTHRKPAGFTFTDLSRFLRKTVNNSASLMWDEVL